MRLATLLALVATCQLAHAAKPPQSVIESCLLGYPSQRGITVSTSNFGHSSVTQDIPNFQLLWADGMRGVRVGYATSHKDENDYVFAGRSRGFISNAIPLTDWKPSRIEAPIRAAYGVVKRQGRNYVCVVDAPGQGSAAFYRVGYIGQFPPKKRADIQLYYAVADIKKFNAFKSGQIPHYSCRFGASCNR
ncbi:hypothetical protein D9M68_517390 [compost metagenome]